MNYKELFKIALLLISSPAKAWEEIRLEEDKRKVYNTFVYPMIGLCALSVFIGSLFVNGWDGPEGFRRAMTSCCITAVALFGGYFLAAYIINEVGVKVCGLQNNMLLAHQFSGYALVVTFFMGIITGLLPEFTLIAFMLQFYTIYVVWEGAPILMGVMENERLKYTFMVSGALIICPAVIQFVFVKLLVLFN